MPRSFLLRINRPNPCRKRNTASGTAYCANESSNVSLRAAKIGSLGTEKGKRVMTRHDNASPTTSTPYQNERVRGTGGRPTSFGEENLLSLPVDRYDDESIALHELCHTIDSAQGEVDPGLPGRLKDWQLQIMMNGRGITGAVAAIPFYTRYEEALELCIGRT